MLSNPDLVTLLGQATFGDLLILVVKILGVMAVIGFIAYAIMCALGGIAYVIQRIYLKWKKRN